MNTEDENDDLKRLFSELRAREARGIRPFDEFLSVTAQKQRTAPRRFGFQLRVATAAILCAIAALIVLIPRHQALPPTWPAPQWTALSDWKAPTDKLLDTTFVPAGAFFIAPSDSLIETGPYSSTTREDL